MNFTLDCLLTVKRQKEWDFVHTKRLLTIKKKSKLKKKIKGSFCKNKKFHRCVNLILVWQLPSLHWISEWQLLILSLNFRVTAATFWLDFKLTAAISSLNFRVTAVIFHPFTEFQSDSYHLEFSEWQLSMSSIINSSFFIIMMFSTSLSTSFYCKLIFFWNFLEQRLTKITQKIQFLKFDWPCMTCNKKP